jgi:hypothetical protein
MFSAVSDAFRGKDTSSVKNQINIDVLTEATMRAVSGCTVDANLSQTVQINCSDNAGNSAGCNSCMDMIAKTRTARDVIGLQSGIGVATDWPTTDACAIACTSCIVRNVTQSQVVQLRSTCDVFADFDTQIKSKIGEAIEEVLAKQEDISSAIGRIFSGPRKTEVINEYKSALQNVLTREFTNKLKTDILAHQTIKIGKKSVIVQHVDQTINAAMVSSLISKSKIQDRVFTDQQVAAALETLKKDTIFADLIDGLTAATVAPLDFLASTMGMIIIIATVGSIILIVCLFLLYMIRPQMFSAVGAAVDRKLDSKLASI